MMTRDSGQASRPRYFCDAARVNYGGPRCQGLAARALDDEVARLVLHALTPAALEVSLRGAADLRGQFDLAQGQWLRRLERARSEADRARRQFDAVEPENRLVARTLEAAWEQTLAAHHALTQQHERFLSSQPRVPGSEEQEQEQIRRLASDLPALWSASRTTDGDRKEILRQVIEEVSVTVEGRTEWCEARIRWAGGRETTARLRRPVARLAQLGDSERLRRLVGELKAEGLSAPRIAERLEAEGLMSPDGGTFTAAATRRLLRSYGLGRARRGVCDLSPGEWLVPDLVRRLGVPAGTVYSWARRGVVASPQIGEGGGRRLVVTGLGERPDLESIRRRIGTEERSHGPSKPPPEG
jgi:hypothetical protein